MESSYATGSHRSIVDRMRGAAMFDVPTYEEVEHDTSATGQAAIVVLLAGGGRGDRQFVARRPRVLCRPRRVADRLGGLVGDRLLRRHAPVQRDRDLGRVAAHLGFAQAPGVLMVIAIVPVLGGLLGIVVSFWLLATGIVAIRQALDVDTGKAVLTALVGWVGVDGRLRGAQPRRPRFR
jgi:hypothetical protein